ncbi:MAG: hypothetical protein C0476_07610 [Sphingomonas sp.]|nr:hypothetical protein [Sphingomonas sp.]
MQIDEVVRRCQCFEQANLAFWVDGGWGVDALLGRQTRPHGDLDLAVNFTDLAAFDRLLKQEGYARITRGNDPEWNWVLQHESGRSVDLHGFVRDAMGNGILGDPGEGSMYPAGAFEGRGAINGVAVRCIAAPFVLAFRNGFEPRDVDHHDVEALCAQFGFALPSRFQT